nr:autotransporter-associated beta strand repeat-containing protein [uncultured Carboxylicivirga sp.]
MKKIYLFILLLQVILLSNQLNAQQLAFPGAEGFGKYTVGGRYGSVYHVTNLNDSGTGSLRDAMSQSNRIIVFDVAGVIKINSTLSAKSNLYVAGQTAPGEGITVYGNRVTFSGANNSICRYMKFRMGEKYGDSGKDALGVSNGSNMIFDHCSISWGRDETFSINWDGKGTEPTNITIQNCIVGQGLMSHSAGGLIQTNGGVTLYRNLYVDNDTRNCKIKGVNQYANNMVYNWRSAAYIMGGDSEGLSYANCVSNYFIKGPDDGGTPLSRANANFHIYADDNWYDADKNGSLNGALVPYSDYEGGPTFMDDRFDYPVLPIISSQEVYGSLIPDVGASLPCRDYVDYYLINEVKSLGAEGKIITSEEELPFGAPDSWSLWGGNSRVDSDGDGIPDWWETANGLDPNSANDAMVIAANGYANIENYINSIDITYSQLYLRKPLNLRLAESTQTTLTLEWYDYTDQEDGYIIEREINGVYTQIGTTGVDEFIFVVENLEPEEEGVFRVKAFNSSIESQYSEVLTCKTKPVPVDVVDLETFEEDMSWNSGEDKSWNTTSLNWSNSETQVSFSNDKKVLFPSMSEAQTIDITEEVQPDIMVVNADSDYSFSGNAIGGGTSVNKAGTGILTLAGTNSYTGATVIHEGIMKINTLANGGVASSIGASQNYDFNWVWLGGEIQYTGSSVSTDRNVALDGNTHFSINNSNSIVTFTGSIGGQGGLTKSGDGTLVLKNVNPYLGQTVVAGGTLELNGMTALTNTAGMGTSGQVVLSGGRLNLWGGESSNYETYNFNMEVKAGTSSHFQMDKTCYLKGSVSGEGVLNYDIYYVREYIQGDWSQFSGTLYANGMGTTNDGTQFMLDNVNGIPNARLVTTGKTKIICWKNASTMRLGGLSGESGTKLCGADKQNNSATMKWIVGGAGTDEIFNGIINNECSKSNYNGTTSIVKEGIGIWRLTGYNTYRGTTVVNDGKLIVNGTHTSTANTTVEGGVLAGKGKLSGRVIVKSGGTLEAGDESISAFSVGGLTLNSGSVVNMDVDMVAKVKDMISSTGSITYGGVLQLNITGQVNAGNAIALFSGSSHIGSFEEIIPASPGEGLEWNFEDGVLYVVASTGIEKVDLSDVEVYPNPVVNVLNLNLTKELVNVEVKIRTISGREIIVNKFARTSNISMPVDQLPAGFYLVELVVDGQTLKTFKIIKE